MADETRFRDRTAVVTGAASGIGRAIATRFVAEGGRVVAGDVDEVGLRALAAELGDRVAVRRADVTSEDDAAGLVATAVDRFGALDTAFNVAGASRASLIVDMTEDDWDFTVDLCLKGVFLGLKHQAREMIRAGAGGSIVNIASLNSRVPMFFNSAYSAAKAGVASLGQSAALELGEHGITVATVSPGLTRTPLAKGLTDVAAVHAEFMDAIPLKRPAQPEDIAGAALFLASADGSYITGVNLFVDGGWEQTAYPDLRPHIEAIMAAGQSADEQP